MTVMSVLSLAASKNVLVSLKDGKLIARGDIKALTDIAPHLRMHKDALLKYFMTELDSSFYISMYHERSAILEYDSNISREEAERLAYQETLVSFISKHYPIILEQFDSIIHRVFLN